MNTSTGWTTGRLLRRWMLATTAGWVVGIPLIVALAAIGERLGLGDPSAVGIGVGLSVGFAQWLVGRRMLGLSHRWMWASVAGMGLPFVVVDVLWPDWSGDNRLLLLSTVGLGGLLTGVWQRTLLRSFTTRSNWWPVVSVVGWCLAAAVASLAAGHPGSLAALLLNVGALIGGGVALGLVTGRELSRMQSAEGS